MPISSPWIPVKTMLDYPGLKADDKVRLTAVLIRETAIATALKIIHGNIWYDKYQETGGQVRYLPNGDIQIKLDAVERHI